MNKHTKDRSHIHSIRKQNSLTVCLLWNQHRFQHYLPLIYISRDSTSTSTPKQPRTLAGCGEKKMHTVKSALFTIQPVPVEVLMTVLLEVEAILNSKWLGYVLFNVADTDSLGVTIWVLITSGIPRSWVPESQMLEITSTGWSILAQMYQRHVLFTN